MPKKTMTFEASMERLEEVLQTLENGDAKLDETLKLYEEGIALVRACNDFLEKAEQTVKMLQISPDGGVEAVDFAPAEE